MLPSHAVKAKCIASSTTRVVAGPGTAPLAGREDRFWIPPTWHRPLLAVLGLNAFLQLADVVSTGLALGAGAVEANPVSRALMGNLSFAGWAAVKVLLAAAFIAAAPLLRTIRSTGEARFLLAASVGFAGMMQLVVVSNVVQTVILG